MLLELWSELSELAWSLEMVLVGTANVSCDIDEGAVVMVAVGCIVEVKYIVAVACVVAVDEPALSSVEVITCVHEDEGAVEGLPLSSSLLLLLLLLLEGSSDEAVLELESEPGLRCDGEGVGEGVADGKSEVDEEEPSTGKELGKSPVTGGVVEVRDAERVAWGVKL